MLRVGPRGPRRFGPPGPPPRFVGPPRGPRRFGGPPRPLFIALMIMVFLMIIGAIMMLMPGNKAKPADSFKYKKDKSPKNRKNKK